ncbi:MAG: YggS family pyridoxal phosphate-dependent enzyme [Eggerthellaceae bacterium]|nr:YggS family pyridoxal phosphate-dependent enzyme [Eggerthellaceae bacterium]
MSLEQRYRALEAQIARCCRENGRDPGEVRILAVSKTVGQAEVKAAIAAGIGDFAENRIEALVEKQRGLEGPTWHFIGNIQSRRIPEIVAHADLIHSLYRVQHVEEIEKAAAAASKVQSLLIEVNTSGEESKGGLVPAEVPQMLRLCSEAAHIRVCGFMTMAAIGEAKRARACFESLAGLAREMRCAFPSPMLELSELSMGMSEDWREAIAAGATMIRLGRIIFDEGFDPES